MTSGGNHPVMSINFFLLHQLEALRKRRPRKERSMFSIGQYLKQVKGDREEGSNKDVVVVPEPITTTATKDYSVLLRSGENQDMVIKSSINDVKPLRQIQKNLSLAMPSEEEIRDCTERTRRALDTVLQSKLKTMKKDKSKSEYVRYTSSNILDDEPTSSRIIKIVDKQEDPVAPPKFKQKKQLERPPSPPAPVLHAPTRKATAEEQKAWYIPPAISNWKNPNGFTIALDNRLAVDGRDPSANMGQEVSQNTIALAEALHTADREAREEIKLRNALKKKIAEKETREKEEKLRQLAQKAREERRNKAQYENDDARNRALAREERLRKAERELKMSRMGKEQRTRQLAKSLGDRDISERTQLGLARATKSVEGHFDSRLFTKSTQITNSEDQPYDNPLFVQQAVNNIYKVSESTLDKDPDTVLQTIENEKRFEDLGPVEFEKSGEVTESKRGESEYGLQHKKQKR
jgi:SNW domain-containing protein 1